MDSIFSLIVDSLQNTIQSVNYQYTQVIGSEMPQTPILDTIYKLAMIAIGFCNLVFTIWLFRHNTKKNQKIKTEESNKYMLNNFILQYKMNDFYSHFAKIREASQNLLNREEPMEDKKIKLDDFYQDWMVSIRANFIDTLGAIDKDLYKSVLEKVDNMQGILTQNLFDEGINLDVKTKYEEMILTPIVDCQNQIVAKLCHYK